MVEVDREVLDIIAEEIALLKQQYKTVSLVSRREILIRLSVLEWVQNLLTTKRQKIVPKKQDDNKPSLKDLLDGLPRDDGQVPPRRRRDDDDQQQQQRRPWPDFQYDDPFNPFRDPFRRDRDFRDPFTPQPNKRRRGPPGGPPDFGGPVMCSSRPRNFDQVLKRELSSR